VTGIRVLTAQLRAALVAFDPGALSGADCASLVEDLALTRKVSVAAEARAAARVASCGAHRDRGFVDPADWWARTSGTTSGETRAALDTIVAVEQCPDTRDALVAGELSLAQAREVARVEVECPGSEAEMLEVARGRSLRTLQDEARDRRLSATTPEALHEQQHRQKSVRHWRDGLGMVRCAMALPPEIGIPFVNRLDAETDRVWRALPSDRRGAPREALAANAFSHMLEGAGRGTANGVDMVLVCDLGAFRRGHLHEGEQCHIVGGGPLPVSVARTIAAGAFLKVVLHDGVRIDTVAHLGRHIKAELRTALELGAPPSFDGIACRQEGCDRRYGLQWDHVDPHANQGVTSYENLEPLCRGHHREKTQRDRAAGLLDGRAANRGPP
jgi:hypothetical protein